MGRVGLSLALTFASKGIKVVGVDVDKHKVKLLNNGIDYLKEPKLSNLLKDALSKNFFKATLNGYEAVKTSDAVIIAVPTPVINSTANLRYIKQSLMVIRSALRRDLLIINESTVPPGTTKYFMKPFLEQAGFKVEDDFYLATIPERISPGKAIEELQNIPRLVGGVGPKSTEKAIELYRIINPNLIVTDSTVAEFAKLAENTFRDINIAYANLLAIIAEKIGIDVMEVISLANTHPRVNIHFPGAGVGGPCLPKDPYMLAEIGRDIQGIEFITTARKINNYMPIRLVNTILNVLKEAKINVKNAKVTVLGLAYKGGVNDTRASPAEIIIRELLSRDIDVIAYDPYVNIGFGARLARNLKDAVSNSDVVVIVTDHFEFKNLNLELLKKYMRNKIIVDGRRVIKAHVAKKHGFRYYGIGYGEEFKL